MKRIAIFLAAALFLMVSSCDGKTLDPQDVPVSEEDGNESDNNVENMKINITIGEKTLTATLVDNSSAKAFVKMLKDGAVTIDMHDYGNFEKVGDLPKSLPRNDEQITTRPGDIILYLGSSITIYYDVNSWNFTRLGRIDNITQSELKKLLGTGNVTVTFSVNE